MTYSEGFRGKSNFFSFFYEFQGKVFIFIPKNSIMKHLLLFCFLLGSVYFSQAQDYWTPLNLPEPGTDAYLLAVNDAGVLVLATTNQIYFSDDEGDNWTPSSNWPGYMPNALEFNSGNTLFVGSYLFGMYRSSDLGLTFEEINAGLTTQMIYCILVMENDDLLVGTPTGIFRSVDDGDNWSAYGTGLPVDYIVTLVSTNTGTLLCGTRENGVYRSEDNGATWTASATGLPAGAEITAMEGTPLGPVFAGVFPDGMFQSTDNGNNWVPYNDGLPFSKLAGGSRGISIDRIFYINLFMYCIIYFYGAYMLPLYLDIPSPAWTQISSGLPDEPTTTDLTGGPGNKIYLCASLQGLYTNTFPVGIPQTTQSGSSGITATPNPVSGKSVISVTSGRPVNGEIVVYNLLGMPVETIFAGNLDAGTATFSWDASNYNSGLYMIRFRHDLGTEVTRVVVSH